MCWKGTRVEYIDEMKSDVVESFRRVVREWGDTPLCAGEIYRRVINAPQKRYYISGMQAYKILARLNKGDTSQIDRMPPYRRQMFFELQSITRRLSRSRTWIGQPYYAVCCYAVGCPAPRLYVGVRTVQQIINEHYKIHAKKRNQ
jgi:hypothetical protein